METYTDPLGYKRYPSNLVHRRIAYRQIYLKNRDQYPLPFGKYVVHHRDGNKKNNDVNNLQILTPEQHGGIHGFSEGKGFDKAAMFLIFVGLVIVLIILAAVFSNINSHSSPSTGLATSVASPPAPPAPEPFFDFQKTRKDKANIEAEIEKRLSEYVSSAGSAIRRGSVYHLANAWGLDRPAKSPGSPFSYTMIVNGFNDEYVVKIIFQGDGAGGRNKHGYRVVVE